MESNDKQLAAPYVSFTTFSTALDGLASSGVPSKIDRSVFPSQSGAVQSQLVVAFRFLGLIDDEGNPQEDLEELAVQDSAKRNAALRRILEKRYAKLFEADLTRIAPSQLDAMIGEYGVNGATQRKAKAFFLKAASAAGIKVSPLLERQTRNRPAKKRNGQQRRQRTRPRSEKPIPPTPPAPNGGGHYKSIHLPNANARLTLSGTFDPFALSDAERQLVYGLADMMTEFEKSVGDDIQEGNDQ